MIKKYRKKPVVIEALSLVKSNSKYYLIQAAEWCGGEVRFIRKEKGQEIMARENEPFDCGVIIIPTLEGNMMAHEGDYIIKGIKGEFYPCKPDIFEATYEEIPSMVKEKSYG